MINYEILSVPAPFVVGPVNAYVIKNDPVTLIDCGPNCPEARKALVQQLSSVGLGLENIKQVIVTHSHSDHYGMAVEIQRISGAAVYMHNKEIPKIRYRSEYEENILSYMAYAGMPAVYCNNQRDYFSALYVKPPEEITGVEDGHIFRFDGFELTGILTAGHSAGHLSLFQSDEGLLFAGDTVLEKVRPKPLVEPFTGNPRQREKNIVQYIDSLNRLKQLKINRVLPGHGKPIVDIAPVLRQLEINVLKRKEEINTIAACLKVFTPFDLVSELFSDFGKALDATMAVSEILGYLDVLEIEGKVGQEQNMVPLTYSYMG